MSDVRIAVITPSRRRPNLVRRAIRQILKQSCQPSAWVIVHDGPSDEYRAIFSRLTREHPWIHFAETPSETRNWGLSPRLMGLSIVRERHLGDYVVFWDDDNFFFKDALTHIRQWIDERSKPDCLLVPFYILRNRTVPEVTNDLRSIELGHIDYANLVVRTELAFACLNAVKNQRDRNRSHHIRGQDHEVYAQIAKTHDARMEYVPNHPIGIYDGLRTVSYWRFRLGIPAIGLARKLPRWTYWKRRIFG